LINNIPKLILIFYTNLTNNKNNDDTNVNLLKYNIFSFFHHFELEDINYSKTLVYKIYVSDNNI